MLSLILALTLLFKTTFFFNTFIWVLIGKPRNILIRLQKAHSSMFLLIQGRSILTKILENTPEEVEKKPLEEESHKAEPELLPNPSLASTIPNPEPLEKEETLILDFMLEFEDELFDEYENTLNYHTMRRPRSLANHHSMKNL
jgi:hypothetical protein